MSDNHDNKKTTPSPYEGWRDPAFNPTTNFSLLGYIIDFFRKRKKDKGVVDFQINK